MGIFQPKLPLFLILPLSAVPVPGLAAATAGPQPGSVAVLPSDGASVDPAVLRLIHRQARRVEANPDDGAAHGELGLVYEANALWREAEACYARAAELDPDAPGWRFHQAIAMRQAGRSAAALALLEDVAALPSPGPAIHQRLGAWRLESGELEAAERAFVRVVEASPQAAEGHAGLGEIALRRRDFSLAAERLERAVAIDPGYRAARYRLGLAYRGLGRRSDAERELAAGVQSEVRFLGDPLSERARRYAVNATTRIDRALGLLSRGNAEQAAALLEAVLEFHPDHVTALNNLAIAYMHLGRRERAFQVLSRALEAEPDRFSTYLNLASWAQRQGRPEEALRYTQRAVALGPHAAASHVALGRALLRLNRTAEAAASFEAAVQRDPLDPRLALTLAELEMKLGHLESAFARLEASTEQWPGLLPAKLGLADVSLALGRWERARAALAAARALAPDDPQVAELAARLESESRER